MATRLAASRVALSSVQSIARAEIQQEVFLPDSTEFQMNLSLPSSGLKRKSIKGIWESGALSCCLLVSLSLYENGKNMLLRNVGFLPTDYTAL
jgi:hypothetical protein